MKTKVKQDVSKLKMIEAKEVIVDIIMGMTKATNFNCRITPKTAYWLLANGIGADDGEISIMCKEYGDDEDWVGMTKDDLDTLQDDPETYQTFELWVN